MKRIFTWVRNVLLNVDRTVASAFGAPPEATISGELGSHEANPVDRAAAAALDDVAEDVFHDPKHCENAATFDADLAKRRTEYYANGGK